MEGSGDLLGERPLEAAQVGHQVIEVDEGLRRHPGARIDDAHLMALSDARHDRCRLGGESRAMVLAGRVELDQRVLGHEEDDRGPRAAREPGKHGVEHPRPRALLGEGRTRRTLPREFQVAVTADLQVVHESREGRRGPPGSVCDLDPLALAAVYVVEERARAREVLREGSGVRAAREAVLERSAGELAEAVERPKRAYPSVDPLDGGVARLDPARPADAEQASGLAGERARRGAEQIRRSHREDDELRVQAPEVTDERLLVAEAGPEDAKIHHAGVTSRREP